jgi:hypothetical protein
MNRWNARVWVGGGLVVLGLLMLLERFGLFSGVTDLFWGLIFLAGASYFFYRFFNYGRNEWWAAIPGFALLGISATILLSRLLPQWGGLWFLAALGLGFATVYLYRREFWWAIIPAGVLITLGFVAIMSDVFGVSDSGGVLFLGMGLTFILVALLANLQWAWIPGIIMLVMGALLGTPFLGSMNVIWPVALIIGGLLLIFQFVRKR